MLGQDSRRAKKEGDSPRNDHRSADTASHASDNVSEVSGSPNSINLKKSIHKSPVGENLEIMFELCILYRIVYVYRLLATYNYCTCMCMVKVVVCLRMHQNAPQKTQNFLVEHAPRPPTVKGHWAALCCL